MASTRILTSASLHMSRYTSGKQTTRQNSWPWFEHCKSFLSVKSQFAQTVSTSSWEPLARRAGGNSGDGRSSGPVSNVPLSELLLDTLSAHTGSIKFIKVPSHVDILGNNQADRLAEQGRLSHPRCPVLKTPSRDFIMPTYTPPTKRQRRTTVADLDPIVQIFNFSPYKDSMGGSVV